MKKLIFILSFLLVVVPFPADIIAVNNNGAADFNNTRATINDSNGCDITMGGTGEYTGESNRDIDYTGNAITGLGTGPNEVNIVASTTINSQHASDGITFSEEAAYEWLFIYYMSFDNNLGELGETVLKDLQNGIVDSNIAVVVQADFYNTEGMKRIALHRVNGKPQRQEFILNSEDSADEVELRKFFEWVQKLWEAKNYAVIFLNHGGTLNHMCWDEQPFKNHEKNEELFSGKWLRASETGKIVTSFNQKVGSKVRLLFLQQCGRASIENLYNFLDSAQYIMASPVRVGVPNTYYTKTLIFAAQNENIGGDILAKSIMEEDEHYTVYTLISNSELKKLPEKITPVLKSFQVPASLNPPESCLRVFSFDKDKFYDLKSYFQALNSANNDIAGKQLMEFFRWYENNLILRKSFRKRNFTAEPSYSGLSICVPWSQSDLEYYSFLPFYKQTNLYHTILVKPQTRRVSGPVRAKENRILDLLIALRPVFVISLVGCFFYLFRIARKT